jgi:hypothetical protein
MHFPRPQFLKSVLHPPLKRVALFLLALASVSPAARATTVVPPSFEQLVSQADYIVRAKVKSVTAEWRSEGANRHIITKVELDVEEVISGTPPQPLVLEMLGGKIGDQEMRVEGAPKFNVGDEDVLFVHGNGKQYTPLVALMHGRYPILHDATTGRAYMAREGRTPLYSEQEVSLPLESATQLKAERASTTPLSPEEFISRIKATRASLPSRPPNEN